MNTQSQDFSWLQPQVDAHPYPILFASLSGAHLYGFPSGDSDYDIRGAHVLALEDVVGLHEPDETVDKIYDDAGREIDVVTHDVAKFFELLLNKNATILEQIYSPLLIEAADEFGELRDIAADCITRHHFHHYQGFARARWEAFLESQRLKPLLYAYRAVFTGIHLMRTGRIEANLATLAHEYRYVELVELVEAKQAGTEKMKVPDLDVDHHRERFVGLLEELVRDHEQSELPDAPADDARDRLSDLLVQIRLRTRRH